MVVGQLVARLPDQSQPLCGLFCSLFQAGDFDAHVHADERGAGCACRPLLRHGSTTQGAQQAEADQYGAVDCSGVHLDGYRQLIVSIYSTDLTMAYSLLHRSASCYQEAVSAQDNIADREVAGQFSGRYQQQEPQQVPIL